jgi:hypothetical protein
MEKIDCIHELAEKLALDKFSVPYSELDAENQERILDNGYSLTGDGAIYRDSGERMFQEAGK